MIQKHKDLIRKLSIELMTHDNDISENSYNCLRDLLDDAGHIDIINSVDATDGRFYLPESFDI